MNKIIKLKRKPQVFRRLTGMSVEKFEWILRKLGPLYDKYNQKRLSRESRKRVIGAGNRFKLNLEERLMMLLMYYRLYITHEFLGVLFRIDDSNVGRNINPLQRLLAQVFRMSMRKIEMSEDEILELIVDGTEQKIQRPKKGQKKYYSGKKKSHTIQHQVIINRSGNIKAVGRASPGKTHDKKD